MGDERANESLKKASQDPDELVKLEQHSQAANQISTGNTIYWVKRVMRLQSFHCCRL